MPAVTERRFLRSKRVNLLRVKGLAPVHHCSIIRFRFGAENEICCTCHWNTCAGVCVYLRARSFACVCVCVRVIGAVLCWTPTQQHATSPLGYSWATRSTNKHLIAHRACNRWDLLDVMDPAHSRRWIQYPQSWDSTSPLQASKQNKQTVKHVRKQVFACHCELYTAQCRHINCYSPARLLLLLLLEVACSRQ